ncbi:protein fem-1 B [Biomphalaria glabrata]|uniref:Protein fem-1 homolog B-like n=1 Tax=Biomphalaria glabrata TaxID=6526 RepID=A0A2C9JSR1_BIOGL|nr:protein fem-1 homolog B-like [Biomphalaria glabrata]XP_055863571.1 protein fem-1 homolog B-like [Biomphalaria glabrata]XP_055863572.1 protein fem-1 homolog B-like [Biomphalaria glabrata]KAI8737669.1 protein fem-1-like protein B-like [Biomphalaria glabrata]KAI8795419.1 protein fem-1 B [Biomphalaria glabrata]
MSGLTPQEIELLKEKVHSAAREGMAISIFALLWNMDKPVVKEILDHQTECDGQKTTPLVIAAKLGETKVVQVLLTNFDVDIEQRSTVRFDGYVIQEATALWCASGAGHLDIVELLIKHGANVNNATATNSTPLRAACFDGRLDIVKYLVEHGADLTIPNKYDNTCLMISCYKGHTKVVRHLLEKGADPDLKAHCGATSIHFAAECGHLEVVKELIHFGASMLKNDLGMTPLMVAAECGKEEIVHYFLKQPECSRLMKIEALELLGSSFANDKETYDLHKTYEYLKEAMALRMVDNRNPHVAAGRYETIPKQFYPTVPAYGNHVECKTMKDLEGIRGNRDALHMEALTIRERILGQNNPEIPHPVIFRGAVFADHGRFDRCISLWMHAMVLRQSNSRSINKDLLRFSQVFSQMVTLKAELAYADVKPVLQHGLQELEQFLKSSPTEPAGEFKSTALEMYQSNILSMIYLITIANRVVSSDKENKDLHRIVYFFLKLKPCLKNGYSPLHIVLDPGICVDDFHVNTIVVFPDKTLMSMFLTCGADIDALDSARNSPLHVITNAKLTDTLEGLRQEIVQELLLRGAHCDIANNKSQTPFMIATGQTFHTLSYHSNISLKCLASRCIRKYRIPYKSCVPGCLESFVDIH